MFKNERKIHIDGQEYGYVVGKRGVAIRTPDNRKLYPSLEEVSGLSMVQVFINRLVGTYSFPPSVIKKYIEEHVHGNSTFRK
jgi:hypothetical protein